MRRFPPGAEAAFEVVPQGHETAARIGNEGVTVVASSAIIGFLEQACHLAIRAYFAAGEASVGSLIDVKHLAPAFPSKPLRMTARLVEVDGRRLAFSVAASQDQRVIMQGRHERHLVRLDRFLSAASEVQAEQAPRRNVTFWFDFHSPWSYLASTRIGGLAQRHDATVDWRPLHLANLIDAIGGRRVLEENPAFVRWYKEDMQDWARLYGLTISYHPQFPLRPARALRAAIFAADEGHAPGWVVRVMQAYWSENADISDLDVLGRLAEEIGLDPQAIRAAATSPVYKDRLERETKDAVARGVFGVPTFAVDDKLFFGNDRLSMLDRHLGGDSLNRFAAGLI
ncbi:thioesterase, FlK family [Rhodoligotrophos defluvii]|uniref:thioesterase, FlK family n=1 Tax=Rhodoligotrophos defluvii TaxID=2561934 RepID=UPI0010C9FFAE|nr:DsbA family protein [Rhodoligotrophos defluvii]